MKLVKKIVRSGIHLYFSSNLLNQFLIKILKKEGYVKLETEGVEYNLINYKCPN
jgi:hypothetical protein